MAEPRSSRKSASAFRTISEASEILGVPQHVLRFWETRFSLLKPMKRGGRRYYRPEDIKLLTRIKSLLYDEGYTIKGAQKHLRETKGRDYPPAEVRELQPAAKSEEAGVQDSKGASAGSRPEAGSRSDADGLEKVLKDLVDLKSFIDDARRKR
ncbi:MAG: MerR family transcriptional regulator [Kiloniellales bacterium]|nr:MerR family transcriptional regulator [Kiloniellales bacterium]